MLKVTGVPTLPLVGTKLVLHSTLPGPQPPASTGAAGNTNEVRAVHAKAKIATQDANLMILFITLLTSCCQVFTSESGHEQLYLGLCGSYLSFVMAAAGSAVLDTSLDNLHGSPYNLLKTSSSSYS
jgi:hypothetical protein